VSSNQRVYEKDCPTCGHHFTGPAAQVLHERLSAETTTPPAGITWLARGKPDFAHWRKDSNVPYDWCGCVSCNDARGGVKTTDEHPPELMAVVDKWQDYANDRRAGRLPSHSSDYATIEELLREVRSAVVKKP